MSTEPTTPTPATPATPQRDRVGTLTLACGTPVFHKKKDSLSGSHLADHLAAEPALMELLIEVMATIRLADLTEGGNLEKVHDHGRIVGKTRCVITGPGDEIFFAKRKDRHGPTRFVRNRGVEDCSTVLVRLFRPKGEQVVVLTTAFIGGASPAEPWEFFISDTAHPGIVEFWSAHALVPSDSDVLDGDYGMKSDDTTYWVRLPKPQPK